MKVSVTVFHCKTGLCTVFILVGIFVDKFPHHTDIDECTEGGHNCSTTQCCVDTIGGFVCQCREGFEPTNDGLDCVGMYVGIYVLITNFISKFMYNVQ